MKEVEGDVSKEKGQHALPEEENIGGEGEGGKEGEEGE